MRHCHRQHLSALLSLAFAAALASCSGPAPTLPDGGPIPPGDTLCTKSSQCPVGQGCIGNLCTPLPCGGCDSDQVCSSVSNTCVPAQGAPCPTIGGCPQGYECNSNNVCAAPCTIDTDCATSPPCNPSTQSCAPFCNSNTGTCAQCVFDSNCDTVAGHPRCAPSGNCVACLQPIDCTTALGTGHFCDLTTDTCKVGCASNSDCNLANGERCDGATSTTPGKCVQCTVATEATDCNAGAPACDSTNHCVQCTADKYCGPATPRCDAITVSDAGVTTGTNTCVQCLPANDANGSDCGYVFNTGPKDPHDELVCDPIAKRCTSGCTSDKNCGCPIDPTSGKETNCQREFKQEHCDPTRTTSADVGDAGTDGACVECMTNAQCFCKIEGNGGQADPSTGTACSSWLNSGAFNGARCLADVCVQGCDTNADCPSNRLCSLSGPTAHQCVECSCANETINDSPGGACTANSKSCGWCENPIVNGQLGGCGPVADENDGGSTSNAPAKVCDAKTLTCRLKRQNESCEKSVECGDPQDPTIGQCIPGIGFCVDFTGTGSKEYCSADHLSGRCGIPCVNLGSTNDACVSASGDCPSGSTCSQSTAIDQPLHGVNTSGHYCASAACANP